MATHRPYSTKSILREVVHEAGKDKISRLAASLAYFAVLAMPGLLVLVVAFVGAVYRFDTATARIVDEMRGLLGEEGAKTIQAMIDTASRPKGSSFLGQALGIGSLVLGATGFFLQLQDSLNSIWNSKPKPRWKGILGMVVYRVFSFGMLLSIGVLLLVSLAMSAALGALGDRIAGWAGDVVSAGVIGAANFVVSYLLIALLFMGLFKVMPDAKITWREVRVGAAVTAALIMLGKYAIGLYLGRSDPGSAYGAAGPLAVILVWVYYSSLIVLLGAEFTEIHGRRSAHHGSRAVMRAHKAEPHAHAS